MELSKIAAHIRFSKDIGGSWKSLELAAEADVTIMDDWTVCQVRVPVGHVPPPGSWKEEKAHKPPSYLIKHLKTPDG